MRLVILDARLGNVTNNAAVLSGTNVPGDHRSKASLSEGFGSVTGDRNIVEQGRYRTVADLHEEAKRNGRQEKG